MKSSLKNARISPKKMNLVAGLVRGKSVNEALSQLKFTPKKGAEILYKVLQSAVSNATNNYNQKPENLVVKSILVTKGMTYKRGIPVSRGRYHPILKRNSNIVVEVGMEAPTETTEAKSPTKTTKKTETEEEKTEKKEAKTTAKKATPKKTEKKETQKADTA